LIHLFDNFITLWDNNIKIYPQPFDIFSQFTLNSR
jgi:hypothetical protein